MVASLIIEADPKMLLEPREWSLTPGWRTSSSFESGKGLSVFPTSSPAARRSLMADPAIGR